MAPLQGAVIQIVNVADKNITQSDINGNYVLSNVDPDRYEIKISYIGYKNVIVPNVVVSSGKETIMDIKMEEDLVTTDEIDVTVN